MGQTTNAKTIFFCVAGASFFALVYLSRHLASTYVNLDRRHMIIPINVSSPPVAVDLEKSPKCVDLLGAVQNGFWVSRTPKKKDVIELESCINATRSIHFGLPPKLQRSDGLCGNLNFGGKMFRALCDPNGPTPCCFEYKCVNKTVGQCNCSTCFDLRPEIHADFGSYVLKEPACKMTTFESKADACSMLKNVSITFIGDSLVRQVYTSFLTMLQHKALNKVDRNEFMSNRQQCREQINYLGSSRHVPWGEVTECNQTVKMQFYKYFKLDRKLQQELLGTVKGLVGKQYSILYIGLGLHEDLNFQFLHEQVVKPMVNIVGKNQWPKIVWATPHCPGPLKSPTFIKQQKDSVIDFIKNMKMILKGYNIAILDSLPLTTGIVSYDGVHYGKVINDIKAQILMNLIQRLRNNGWSRVH
ncbi:uncharacterized protein LOC101849568 [Aplysia californica]|uniref:Uncharacterized protein LOC101849568 n=1 Tax=Aplysia californica TaxID=6500 RepID=A0ABM0K7W6_APLCA|nr:uncharacterized protein LOC101849568 [Aplysia californica]